MSGVAPSRRTRLPLIDTPMPLKNWFGAKPDAVDAEVSGFNAVSLGPRVLRTESAAIATLAVLQSLWGDLR